MESNSSLPTHIGINNTVQYNTAYKDYVCSSFSPSATLSAPKLLKCETDNTSILPRNVLLATLLYLCSYKLYSNGWWLWKSYVNVVTQICSEFYWYIHTLPQALCTLDTQTWHYTRRFEPSSNFANEGSEVIFQPLF